MATDQKFIGKEYKPITYIVGQEKIKEYALAIGDKNPLYHGGNIAPPMFVVVFAKEVMDNLFCDKELNLNMKRLVHGEQEFNFHKMVKANDTIKTTGKIRNIYTKNNNDFIELETNSHNQNNELVVDGIWTFIIRGS